MKQTELDILRSSLELLRDDPDRLLALILQQAQVISELKTEIKELEASN